MILVTGASGFVGCNLCRSLAALGRPFRALVRSSEKAQARGLTSGSLHVGDLFGDLDAALADVTAIVHLAGLVRAVRPSEMMRVNEQGTARLVDAAARFAPGARFLHVSSLAAAGPSDDGASTDVAPELARPVSSYGRSKLAAERRVTAGDNPWLVLRPSIVYGPWDTDVLMMFKMMRKPTPLVGPSLRYSLVFVDDLVRAIVRAIDSDAVEHCLPIAHGRVVTQREWLVQSAAAVGARARFVRLPRAVAAATAGATELWSKLVRRPALFGLDKYREMRAGSWVADVEPARRVLGFAAETDHADGFRRTVAWYRENGWL